MSQLLLDIVPDWEPRFENFVTGRNLELVSALRHSVAGTGGERNFYLWGESGSGKSHLLRACEHAGLEIRGNARYSRGEVAQMATLVAIDDVELLDDTAQIELFDLYNRMRENGGLLLVSGKQSPLHLKLRDDLRTRLGWGLVFQVHALNDSEKAVALQNHARQRGFALPEEVAGYLLRHGRRDLPSLMAVLDALDEHSLRLHRPPSVPLLKEILQIHMELK